MSEIRPYLPLSLRLRILMRVTGVSDQLKYFLSHFPHKEQLADTTLQNIGVWPPCAMWGRLNFLFQKYSFLSKHSATKVHSPAHAPTIFVRRTFYNGLATLLLHFQSLQAYIFLPGGFGLCMRIAYDSHTRQQEQGNCFLFLVMEICLQFYPLKEDKL